MYCLRLFVILSISNINYITSQSYNNPQSDVGAPAYAPYVKSNKYSNYGGSKRSYSGTKTGRYGTKTVYSGTKTGPRKGYSGYGHHYNYYGPTTPSYESFRGNAVVNPYKPVCNPDCKNNGICIAEGVCKCSDNFFGNYCEFEKIPCMTHPPTPMNSEKMCSSEMCTIKCLPGHQFIDGTSAANMRCENGQWRPTRSDFTSIPDCVPICEPPCLNGGACLSLNTCQCPPAYRGLQCQYSVNECDHRKLGFNGPFSCSGDMDSFSCKLTCPPGSNYSTPPADVYTCLYSTGEYKPQPIPRCVFNDMEPIILEQQSIRHPEHPSETHASYIHRYHSHSSAHTVTVIDYSPKEGTCFTWGGTHYKTFDGKVYSFHSTCQHILMRDKEDHKYTVAVSQGVCKRQYYCPSEISVFLEDKQYFFSVGEEGGVVFRNTRRLLPIPASLPGLRVSMPKDTVFIHLDGIGATVKWDTQNLVMIEASVALWNNTEGLCGNLDGREETDFLTKDGNIALTTSALASCWQLNKIGEPCERSPTSGSACEGQADETVAKSQAFCTSLLTKEKFRKCSNVMDVTPLLEACQWDYCACAANQSPEDCACNTITVYAQECLKSGVEEIKTWRDENTCPMKCTDGKIYKSCGPDTIPSCAMPSTVSKVDNTICVEGCYCPDGLYLEEGLCVPKEECPCRLRTKIFKPGSVVPKDCNTCTCEAGEWKCTQASCGARCGAVGDPHYTTFDGLKYDFMGHCVYNLLKSDNVTIEVENVACSGSISEEMNLIPSGGPSGKPSCTKAVNIIIGGTNIHLKQGGFILVNGKDISSLPVHIGEICIRTASSLFIIVELPNDVDLWWDGNTRVFVDVPPEFRDKTKGLCGTFNHNQKDDFLTPEGDIEQTALAFANKWKTREFCDDVAMTEPEHPCKTNVENKESAEKYCSKLKSKIFQECHWHVDVEPYYEECVYDLCACTGDVQRCLCPILGDYAMACARNGIKIQWRYNVKECELKCDGGQEYTVCADSCQRTCTDIAIFSTSNRCKPTCVEGCACPPGQVLDAQSQCVPIGLCPCIHKGLEFQPGYKEVRPGRRERELCTCVGARWDCRPATTVEIQNYPPAEDIRMNCSATLHLEFTSCETAEPLTCKNMHLPPSSTTAECRPGCQCQKGYVLDTSSKKCVMPVECPCHHGGQSYPDGHIMQEECNTCSCKRGNWTCTSRKCVGVCSAWGDSHFTTFDGKYYDFEGVCTYLMAKGVMETGKDGFDVEIQNMPCGTTGATCSKSVTLKVRYGDNIESVSLSRDAALPDTSKLKSIQLREAGVFVFLDVPSLGMTLQWERAMRVYVKVDPMWENRLKGLCGNYNNDQRDDFQTPSGGGITESSALTFADSWKLKPTCPKPVEVKDHCQQRPERKEWAISTCSTMKRFPFTKCHTEVSPTDYITKCERDACACDTGGDCECACTAIAAYAQVCISRGVEIRWRSESLCPMQCDEEEGPYESCLTACPLETCDNTLTYEEIKRSCERDTCVEGCKPKEPCPKGKVYSNSSHTECIPRTQCRPICMKLENGKEVLEGEIVEEDACHTCRCSHKERVCTGVPCSTEPPIITVPTPLVSTVVPEEERAIPVRGELVIPSKPSDEPLKCVKGWTSWISRSKPEPVGGTNSESIEKEPLPSPKELEIGSPMCEKNMMKKIECRTIEGHKTSKETGLNAECSLENGLLCKETGKSCPDFEIRVYCECEEKPFQCLDSIHPNHPHPSDCHKFYECTPDPMSPDHPHAVLKSCGENLMYNPQAMVCDWPASVIALRPECGKQPETTTFAPEVTVSSTSICPPGQVYSDCAYPCDKLCHNFLNTLRKTGKCTAGEKCVSGCMDERAARIKCDYNALWRDEHTCVPIKDCTCYSQQGVVKPSGVVIDGCERCQCLDNEYHCQLASECVATSTELPERIISEVPLGRIPFTTVSTTITSTHAPITIYPSSFPTTITISTSTLANATTGSIMTSSTSIPTQTTVQYTTPTTTQRPKTSILSTVTTASPGTTVLIIQTSVTPPPQCNPNSYIYLLWDDKEMPDSAFSASSMASELFAPQNAVLNGHPMDITAGSWNPATMDTNQYLQVELPRREPIYGVIMQGSPLFDQYVTSYEVMYGDDGNVFSTVNGPDNKPKIFRGPVDHESSMKQMIEPPIEAKYIRIRPLTWHEEIAIRFELIGCKESLKASTIETYTAEQFTTIEEASSTEFSTVPSAQPFSMPGFGTQTTPELPLCIDPIGFEAGLPINNVEVSSNPEAAKYLGLKEERGWRPLYSTPGEWILFDFTDLRNITGVKTKGDKNGWVESYYIMYAANLTTFNPLLENGQNKVFPANFDGDNEVVNMFSPPIHARYLKVLPLKWHNSIEMRIEPIGCYIPYPTEKPTTEPEGYVEEALPVLKPTVAPCELCPGAHPPSDGKCPCAPPLYYDGESCTDRALCPCFVSFMPYAVGATYRGMNCDECTCKLGGVSSCQPIKECKCAPDLVPKLSYSLCECTCEACPEGTKICPTSHMCLKLESWCDGLLDCPDDEVNCTTTMAYTTPTTTVHVETTVAPTTPTTVIATTVTTEMPKTVECPKPQCAPGYTAIGIKSPAASRPSRYSTSDLPPPRQRKPYERYRKGTKGGYSNRGYSKGGGGRKGFQNVVPQQQFDFARPSIENTPHKNTTECPQFQCVRIPPYVGPGSTTPIPVCSAPKCPPNYALTLDTTADTKEPCPQYVCVPPPERAVFCNMTGRTFNTFDGSEYKYDVCFHVLARENRFNSWSILVKKRCNVSSCENDLFIKQDRELLIVKSNLMIEYDHYEYTYEQARMMCFQKNSFDISKIGNGLAIASRKYNITVLYFKNGDIKIGVFKNYLNSVDGLCGTFNQDASDDRSLPNGTVALSIDEFGRSWAPRGATDQICQPTAVPPEEQKECWNVCSALTKAPLSECAKVLNLDRWRSICLDEICECADLEVNGTRKSRDQCRCELLERFVAECLAADKNIELSSWRVDFNCPTECPPPLVHNDCFRKNCEPTCSSLGMVINQCPVEDGLCFPGCYCPEGKLRRGDDCVAPTECRDCVCNGPGNSAKYVTFERDDLPFGGNCTYLAARDRNDTGHHKFEVYSTNGPCENNTGIVCTKIVHLIYEKNVLHVQKNKDTDKLEVKINGEKVFKYPTKNEWATITLVNTEDINIFVPDVHLEITVIRAKMEFIVRLPSYIYANKTEGLCGTCAGYSDDLVMKNGTTAESLEDYGNSWQASSEELKTLDVSQQDQCGEPQPTCLTPSADQDLCLNVLNTAKFGKCYPLVDPTSFVESCQDELCVNPNADLCTILERYTAECRRAGVCLDWRSPDLCPYSCSGDYVYRPCVKCQPTCEDYERLAADPNKCDNPISEGCYCPEGKVRVNDTCIEPSKCFPCDVEHYVGDEWQENACKKCSCTKPPNKTETYISCNIESCTKPICEVDENLIEKPLEFGACCKKYSCVPKPKENVTCEEPKQITCGFGQVLKQKTTSDGCKALVCECKPANECDPLPSANDVEALEPGMERVIDESGCCPLVRLECKPKLCPIPAECPALHKPLVKNITGMCCPQHSCELPKDKCVVTLKWEAGAKGGEQLLATPETVLKDLDSVWWDGPCRSCRCDLVAGSPAASCSHTECPAIISTDDMVMEPEPVPFACCSRAVPVACRQGDNIYKVGENWTSPYDPCESYKCVEVGDGKLENQRTVQGCETDCQPGWKYTPADKDSGVCCGKCKPFACLVDGAEKAIGTKWTSEDHCTNYTCVDVHGTLQVQTTNESCLEPSIGLRKQFVLKEEKVEGKCCKLFEPVACRVGNAIYQEGQMWPSDDPCKNLTCGRDDSGQLAVVETVERCEMQCQLGWEYKPATSEDKCCGRCEHVACVSDGELKPIDSKWTSEDNCTTYECVNGTDSLLILSSQEPCPDISGCAVEDRYMEGCCNRCRIRSDNQKVCAAEPIPSGESIGFIRIHLGPHGICTNKHPLQGFKECVGRCDSKTVYNSLTGNHDSDCKCCQVTKNEPIVVLLNCADGTQQEHQVASPLECNCSACQGSAPITHPTKTGPTKTGPAKGGYHHNTYNDIPAIDPRFQVNQGPF